MTGRDQFLGARVAVAGMGVSGVAVARACRELGARPTLFEQQPGDVPEVLALTEKLQAQEVDVETGWNGRLDAADFEYLVVSPGFKRDHPCVVDMQGREVLSEVEFGSRVAEAPILAVTGTNGKSTTVAMLYTILRSAGREAYLCGNISGSGLPEEPLTSAAMRAPASAYLVAEVSSYQLEFVKTLRPKVAACTNVTPDHQNRHPSFEDYFETKMRLFDNMAAGDVIVANVDERSVPVSRLRKPMSRGARLVLVSPKGNGVGENAQIKRTTEKLWIQEDAYPLSELPFYGEHNLANAMMAWEMARAVSKPTMAAVAGLTTFQGLANRLEFVGKRNGVDVVNNSMCTNPAAVIASSLAIKSRQHILMGGNTKNLDFSPVARYLENTEDQVYLFGPRQEELNRMLGGQWPAYNSLKEAFLAAVASAVAGEVVILSPGCASSEPFANFRERGDAFKKIAKEWLGT
ncbi:MAG: UDP-N-acetylmuramoyl-L-alanine--D-glutamate ligase [Armatimonadetes bacterium]|nr:UDP-N-acetylmuramoyl-L-alanine--D-glutamate ligase [Armatimonadota bacterium]